MSNWKKFIVGSDVHGDMADKNANEVFFQFTKDFKPDIRVLAGDLWDFRALRRGACEEEKRESITKDYVAGINWLKQFKPHYYLRGNHCQRLWQLADDDKGVLSDYAQSGVVEVTQLVNKMGCKMFAYNKRSILRLGSLKILHGFFSGMNAAKQHALIYGACLFGHVHTVEEYAIPGLERRVARSIGALCQLDMDYNAKTPSSLRHAHGFAYGVINQSSGQYHVWQAESIGGTWSIPSDIVFYGKKNKK